MRRQAAFLRRLPLFDSGNGCDRGAVPSGAAFFKRQGIVGTTRPLLGIKKQPEADFYLLEG